MARLGLAQPAPVSVPSQVPTLWVRLVNNTTPFDFRFSGVAEWGQVSSQPVHSNVFTVYDNQ